MPEKAANRQFILVGDVETWKVALEGNVWGFSERSKGNWNSMNNGDQLAFYATAPVKRIIGFGILSKKFVSDTIVFPDEIFFKKAIWKYRFKFVQTHKIDDWSLGLPVPESVMLNVGRKLINANMYGRMIKMAERRWDSQPK